MTITDPFRRLPISTEDFLGLKANAQDRDRNLRLTLAQTDIGEDFIMVEVSRPPIFPGFPTKEDAIIATVIRSDIMGRDRKPRPGWIVHHPEDGPIFEFDSAAGVASFLAFGETASCRRSWASGRAYAAERDGGAAEGATHREVTEKRNAVPGKVGRTRFLPMLGDRAGE